MTTQQQRNKSNGRKWTKPMTVSFAEFTAATLMQVRQETKDWKVRDYVVKMTCGEDLGPVKIARLPDGALVLIDGFHRVKAIQKLNGNSVQAIISDVASVAEARIEAGLANLTHGLELNKLEKRGVFRAYIHAKYHILPGDKLQSYRNISKGLKGMQHFTTIRNWMIADFPKLAIRIASQEQATATLLPTVEEPLTNTTTNQFTIQEEETYPMDCTTARTGIEIAMSGIGTLRPNGRASSKVRALQTWAERDLRDGLNMIEEVRREQEEEHMASAMADPNSDY